MKALFSLSLLALVLLTPPSAQAGDYVTLEASRKIGLGPFKPQNDLIILEALIKELRQSLDEQCAQHGGRRQYNEKVTEASVQDIGIRKIIDLKITDSCYVSHP
jgi:hypothetical protein